MEKIERIKKLVEELNIYSQEYYTLDSPTISDKEYDKLYDELVELEKETGVTLANSPTQRVGDEIKEELEKVQHKTPLKSLGKTKDINELIKFSKGQNCLLMYKMDGLTNEIIYNNGILVGGSTRGNAFIGEDITHNILTYKNLPKHIPFKGLLRISGEAFMKYTDFNKINEQLPEDKKYKTPRNLTAGSVRQLNSSICNKRNINYYVFGLLEAKGKEFKYKHEEFEWLKSLGFEIVPYYTLSNVEINNNLSMYIDDMRNKAKEEGIPIDGEVLAFNDIEYGKKQGETSHHFNNAIAYKFFNSTVETTLESIQWQVGRTGIITPVANFQEVEIDGTDVNKASVHNISIFKSLRLGKNDKITVFKANEIIPQIQDNFTRSNTFEIPSMCPICGSKTQIKQTNNAEFLICTNPSCSAKLSQKIKHYCSRDCMNIDGFSIKGIEKFIEKRFINNILDIYKINEYKNQIINMEGFGLKSYNNLINSIEKSRKCKLSAFIFALGIPNVGKKTAQDLTDNLKSEKSIDKFNLLRDLTTEILMNFKDMGEVTAKSIYDYFNDDKNNQMINELLNEIEFIEEEKKENIDGAFSNMSIYCTGTFECGKKKELKQMVESNGGTFANGYNKKLNLLVIGKLKGSSKEKKAIEDDIKVITEDEFLEMIK